MTIDIVSLLAQKNILDASGVSQIRKEIKSRGADPEEVLLNRGISGDAIAQTKAEAMGIPYHAFAEDEVISRETLLLIPQQSAQHYQMIAFSKDDQNLYVGMARPENNEAQQAVKFIAQGLGLGIKIFVVSSADVMRFVKGYTSFGDEMARALASIKRQAQESAGRSYGQNVLVDFDQAKNTSAEDAPIIKMVSEIVKNAIISRASDIHIEPERTRLKVRYRVDGDLASTLFLPIEVHSAVLSRIKILAEMKIDETRVPQDGRFGALLEGRQIDFRVSTFPTTDGEKVAIRILDPSVGLMHIENLGLSSWNRDIVLRSIKKPFGMILVTGPTGSGNSTSLYAFLQILNQDNVNVVTLEDPVEYFVQGVNQSQVIPEIGYSFASGLRSILRQDPDIIMVGEIRDKETAELAVHSALTGHLVLSTLHTNNAVGTIPRLLDLGVQRFLIPATLNVIVAQRLARRLCNNCKRAVELTAEQQQLIETAVKELPLEFAKTLSIERPYQMCEPVGCDICKGKGFLGRVGIYEVLRMTPELERVVLSGESETNILAEAKRQGMVTLRQEAVLHLLNGVIPFAEVVKETY
jgi:type IV pilus assembly protein PilB